VRFTGCLGQFNFELDELRLVFVMQTHSQEAYMGNACCTDMPKCKFCIEFSLLAMLLPNSMLAVAETAPLMTALP